MLMQISVSPGELIDRMTINQIKMSEVLDPGNLLILAVERRRIMHSYKRFRNMGSEFFLLCNEILDINQELWRLENRIRFLGSQQDFGPEFIMIARSIYMANDRRSSVKNKITQLFGTDDIEIKQYA